MDARTIIVIVIVITIIFLGFYYGLPAAQMTEWESHECIPNNSICGDGKQKFTRSCVEKKGLRGPSCEELTQTEKTEKTEQCSYEACPEGKEYASVFWGEKDEEGNLTKPYQIYNKWSFMFLRDTDSQEVHNKKYITTETYKNKNPRILARNVDQTTGDVTDRCWALVPDEKKYGISNFVMQTCSEDDKRQDWVYDEEKQLFLYKGGVMQDGVTPIKEGTWVLQPGASSPLKYPLIHRNLDDVDEKSKQNFKFVVKN